MTERRGFADVWEERARLHGDRNALVQGERRLSWAAFDERAGRLATAISGIGIERGDHVAHCLFNSIEYLESTFAMFKSGVVPVNTNYRYRREELQYVWDNSDAAAVIFHTSLANEIEQVRPDVGVREWIAVIDGPPCPDWARDYEALVDGGTVTDSWPRSPDDLLLLYTGGTTGMPKGVVWPQGEVYAFMSGAAPGAEPAVHLVPCPLMHASGGWAAYGALSRGDVTVLLEGRRFDAVELLDTIDREGVASMNIVGEAFAQPIAVTLNAHPGRWRLDSLRRVSSTGAAVTPKTMRLLREVLPDSVKLTEGLSSSEAVAMGSRLPGPGEPRFAPYPGVRVLRDDGSDVAAGSEEVGVVAAPGLLPIGYYKDEEATESTFRVVDGVRYALSGDLATVLGDGTFRLIGRGNLTINTGGEKVFGAEVESVLLQHPDVDEAAVVGMPDALYGERVAALVRLGEGTSLDVTELKAFVAARLASYKAPRVISSVIEIPHLDSGKPDYKTIRTLLAASDSLAVGGDKK